MCKQELVDAWQAQQMGFSAFKEMPSALSDFIIAHTAAKVASRLETNIWAGQTATAGQFDGFYYLATAGGFWMRSSYRYGYYSD